MVKADYGAFTRVICDRVSAQDAATALGISFGRDGRCKCLFCGSSRKDTLRLYPENRGYFCFACHAGGDVISLWREVTGANFREAVEEINAKFGLGLPLDGADPGAVERARAEAERRRKEAERREEEQKRLLEALWDAADAVWMCEQVLRSEGPQKPGEAFSARYEAAAKNIGRLKEYRDELYVLVYGEKD